MFLGTGMREQEQTWDLCESSGDLFCQDTGWVGNATSSSFPDFSFPRSGVWGITFPTPGSATIQLYTDSELTQPHVNGGVNLSDNYAGGAAGITHIGVGANLGNSVWSQYLKQVR